MSKTKSSSSLLGCVGCAGLLLLMGIAVSIVLPYFIAGTTHKSWNAWARSNIHSMNQAQQLGCDEGTQLVKSDSPGS